MLYMMTHHSLWNCKHHPFLLCACHRGEGIRNRNQKCKMLTEQEHQSRHSRSQHRWTYKSQEDVTYDQKKHPVWCNDNNI
eukprot:12600858-Ditylum_brightwellii.AAC.1